MKTSDISQTPIVKRYGARGARLFSKLWFSTLYLILIAITAGLWLVGPEYATGWRRLVAGCFVGALVVFAASFLTRMRLNFLAELEQLEAREKRA